MNDTFLAALDTETQQDAEAELLACCASERWAAEVAARRPYHDLATLRGVSGAALDALDWPDVLQALAGHPRIGEPATGEGGAGSRAVSGERGEGDQPATGGGSHGRAAEWSRAEQATVSNAATTDERTAAELAAGNAEYERRFGHVFLICASGRTAAQVLAALRERLANDEDTERRLVRAELRKIVDLRLARLVGE